MANKESADANAIAAAVAVARIEGEQIATVMAERETHGLQEELKNARLEAANTQAAAAKITNRSNLYLEELKSHEEARSSLQRVTSSNAKCPPALPTGTIMHQLSTARSAGIVPAPTQFDQTTLTNAGASTLLVGGATHPPPGGTFSVDQFCAVCFRLKTDNCVGCGRSA
eukprot:5953411-Pyramimonas_sp.AAC.1